MRRHLGIADQPAVDLAHNRCDLLARVAGKPSDEHRHHGVEFDGCPRLAGYEFGRHQTVLCGGHRCSPSLPVMCFDLSIAHPSRHGVGAKVLFEGASSRRGPLVNMPRDHWLHPAGEHAE